MAAAEGEVVVGAGKTWSDLENWKIICPVCNALDFKTSNAVVVLKCTSHLDVAARRKYNDGKMDECKVRCHSVVGV